MDENKLKFYGGAGALRTASLFYERWKEMKPHRQVIVAPIYSLYRDEPDCVNARTAFLALRDPTGYKFANQYLAGWDHWLYLQKFPWFREAVDVWLSEFEARQRAEALDKLRAIANGGSPNALAAAKYLATAEYKHKDSKRGRPSNAEKAARLRDETQMGNDEEEDLQRMKPTLVVSNS